MANGIRKGDSRGFSEGRGSRVRQKAGGYIDRKIVEITIKMMTMAQKPLMIKMFSHSPEVFFSFNFVCLMLSASNIPKIFVSFLYYELSDFFLDLVVLFLQSFVVFYFSLLAWHILFLYSHCIFLLPVWKFSFFSIVANSFCRPYTLGDWFFSCYLVSLYPPENFLDWVASSLLPVVMVIVHLPGIYLCGFSPQLNFFLLLSTPLSIVHGFID